MLPAAVIFDIDGTLLDSAPGIVAGFRHALLAVGVVPPSDDVLRSDLGPPVDQILGAYGVPPERLAEAVHAYRSFYRAEGMQQSVPYAGVVELLDTLTDAGVRLAAASAKRTDVADRILALHRLAERFATIRGTTDRVLDKAETVAEVLAELGTRDAVMVGDRHSDVTAGRANGLVTVGVTWGYGTEVELRTAGADLLVASPAELTTALRGGIRPARPASR